MRNYTVATITKNDVDYLPGLEKKDLLTYYGLQKKERTANADDSEQSYDVLSNTYSETNFKFLSFNNIWQFFIGITVILQYATFSYMECFDRSILKEKIFITFQVLTMFMNATDILSSTLHYFDKNARNERIHKKKRIVIFIFDLVFLVYIPFVILLFVNYHSVYSKITLFLTVYRLFRPIMFFFTITKSPLRQSLKFVLLKYTILLCIIIHTVAWVWMLMGCVNCKDNKFRWTDDVPPGTGSGALYAKCLYMALGASTSVGQMGAKLQNDGESMVLVIMMYFNLFIMTGVFLGAFAAVQVDKSKRHFLFGTRLNSIQEQLQHPNISESLRKKTLTWYQNYWNQESGITDSELLAILPESMEKEINLDKYWYALNQSLVLRNCSHGLLRAIADVMTAVSYNAGDIIMHQDKIQGCLLFVAKGFVQVVAPDDIESPIITFGYGTCLGDLSLYLNFPCGANVLAASYCKIFVLKKEDLWKTLIKYGKLHDNLHVNVKNTLNDARIKQIRKKQILQSTKKVEKTLKKVKKLLKDKFNHFRFDSATSKLFFEEKEAYDLYIINKIESNVHRDKIFFNSTWPWILYPKTQLILIWNTLIFIYSIVVLLIYPYDIFYLEEYPIYFDYCLRPIAYLLFSADIVLQLFTAVEDDQQNLSCKLSDIISKRLSQFSFLIDLASILPLELILSEPLGKSGIKYCLCNHLLKIIRVISYFGDLSSNFKIGTSYIKILFYVVYLGYLGYLQGILYYSVAGCPSRPCPDNSWVIAFKNNLRPGINIQDDSDCEILLVSILYGLLLTSSTGGSGFITNDTERIFSAIFIISSIFLYTYLVADYTSTLTLSQMIRQKFLSNVATVRNFMIVMNAKDTLVKRINIYLEAQWELNQGVKLRELMYDMPKPFYDKFSKEKYVYLIRSVLFFRIFNSEMIKEISGYCVHDVFPPNEFIAYAGSITGFMYIIEKGFCEMKASGQDRIENVIGPLESFNVFEMILEVPALYNVKCITNVSVLKISLHDIKMVLAKDKYTLNCVSMLVTQFRNTFAVERLFIRNHQTLRILEIEEEKTKSFFIFPNGKLHPLNKDYLEGWKGFSLLRPILRRTTILPSGKFLYFYLVFQAVISFLICVVNTCDFIYETVLPRHASLGIVLPLDIICLIDVYIRMHICYYNKDGILVTHPKCTAIHYFSTSFAVDFITALPVKLILSFLVNKKNLSLIVFVKLLRIYRIPHGFAYWSRDRLKNESIRVSVFKYAVMTLVVLNTVAAIGVIIGCKYIENKNGTTSLIPDKQSWVYTKHDAETSIDSNDVNPSPLKIYFLAIYYFGCVIMQLGLGDFSSVQQSETIFTIIMIMAGYLWFTYILVLITNTKAVVNENLTIYQTYMKDMLNFLQIQSIPKLIQNKTISHFEYLWQRTQGSTTTELLGYFHPTLKADIITSFYYETLSNVPLFVNADSTFYNYLGESIVENYYLHNSFIIQVNNIIDSIYIVHRGEVRILGSDSKPLVLLKKGGLFGNLDDLKSIRSMISAETTSTADILQIKSQDFYTILGKYPYMKKMLQNHLLYKNMFYINTLLGSFEITEGLSINTRSVLSKLERFCMSRIMDLFCMMIALNSYVLVFYQAVFQFHSGVIIGITYVLDFLHIIKIYLAFNTPYFNEMGEIISNKKMIKKRYIKKPRFYFDIFALLPFEILSLAFDRKNIWMYIAWFRINRLARVFNVGRYFSVTDDHLNINVMATKLSANLIYFTLYTHTLACIWYLIACPNGKCSIESWSFNKPKNISACNRPYICALYYTTNLITYTGYPTMVPRSYFDVSLCILSVCVSKFVISIVISNTAAIVRYYGYKLGEYSGKMIVLKTYFVNCNISYLLQSRMLNYLEKLWFRRSSSQTPVFLDMAPTTLSEEIKVSAFGIHIFNNYIFHGCHSDFLRLVTSKTKMLTFFYNDIICTHGDINDTMYFIHRGRVNVLLVRPFEELIVDVLEAQDCFGMIQGLFANTPHSHSYQAKAVTEVITLRLSDWEELLQFYPASKFLIYNIIRNYNKTV